MHDRPAVLVRIEDADGAHGWGEAWCNFPACGAEHRARLIETVLAPLLLGRTFASPEAAFRELSAKTAVLAIQSGEPGPIAQSIAGVDIALHDLAARRAGRALWRHLARNPGDGAAARAAVPLSVYASGINPDQPGSVVEALRREGHIAFKLKVGFAAARDVGNLAEVRAAAGPGAAVMVDANQAWPLDEAIAMSRRLAEFAPVWIEEPLRADRPWLEWQRLAAASTIPFAAGENAIGDEAFDALIASRAIAIVQPDLAKWGGVSGVLR
jgi:L-alanine-DL-glutamate epimerase and related enzymes of enolase superfamily